MVSQPIYYPNDSEEEGDSKSQFQLGFKFHTSPARTLPRAVGHLYMCVSCLASLLPLQP